nr:hypothetical protein [Tanacetum cinerariifolium]
LRDGDDVITLRIDFLLKHMLVHPKALGVRVARFINHRGRDKAKARLRVLPDYVGQNGQYRAAELARRLLVGAQPVAVYIVDFGIKIGRVEVVFIGVNLDQVLAARAGRVHEKPVDVNPLPAFAPGRQVAVALHVAKG